MNRQLHSVCANKQKVVAEMKKAAVLVAVMVVLFSAGCSSAKVEPTPSRPASFKPSALVYLGGFVQKPGTYTVQFGATYGEVIALAGGLRPEADATKIDINKTVEGTVQIYVPSTQEQQVVNNPAVAQDVPHIEPVRSEPIRPEPMRFETRTPVGVFQRSGSQPTPRPVYRSEPANDLSSEEQQMLALINSERDKKGVKPLIADSRLVKAARLKSQDMIDNDYFAHESAKYGTPSELVAAQGVSYHYVGENLAVSGTVQQAHRGLMGSPGHRQNILNPKFRLIGIGIIKGRRGVTVSQEFTD